MGISLQSTMIKAIALAACVAVVSARPRADGPPSYGPAPGPIYKPAPAPYKEEKLPPQPFAYEYGVKDDYSGAAYTKQENQNEYGAVEGSYKVSLPDGRIQTVRYHADHDGGYVADVTYEGTPVYPDPPKGGYGPYTGPGAYKGPRPVVSKGYAPAPPAPAYAPARR